MAEQPKFPGLWMCPDYKVALNDSPPFRYKCEGMELTGVGSESLERELFKQYRSATNHMNPPQENQPAITPQQNEAVNGQSALAGIYARKIQDWAESINCLDNSREEMIKRQATIIDQAIHTATESLRGENEGFRKRLEDARLVVVKYHGHCSTDNFVRHMTECVEGWHKRTVDAEQKLSTLEKQVAAYRKNVEEVLAPFARLGETFSVEPYAERWPDNTFIKSDGVINYHNFITIGQCRAAAKLLTTLTHVERNQKRKE